MNLGDAADDSSNKRQTRKISVSDKTRNTAIRRNTSRTRKKTMVVNVPPDEDTRITTGNPKSPDTIMRVNLSPYVKRELIVDLKSTSKDGALKEMCTALHTYIETPSCTATNLMEAIQESEERINTQMGPNWATPHARVDDLPEPLMMVIGRSKKGVLYSGDDKAPVNLIVLLLAREDAADRYLHVLSSVVSTLRDEGRVARLIRMRGERNIRAAFTGKPLERRMVSRSLPRVARGLIRHMLRFADDIEVGSVLLNVDAFDRPELLRTTVDDRTILVTAQRDLPAELTSRAKGTISLPFAANNMSAMLRLAVALAIGRKLISRKARVLALAGPSRSNTLDQMRLFNAKDFPTLNLNVSGPEHIQPGVLERVLEIASTTAREGREGKAIGTAFVIGDEELLTPFTRQLVINPFHGYERAQLNVLDVTLEETIKEFASIDGAFVISSDGTMLSAGTYLAPPQTVEVDLPSGLGSRHRSAAMMTLATSCVATVVSESTRTVSVFADGKLALSLDMGDGQRLNSEQR